ncbi:LysR family transcriptional regulator [Sphingomonas qilianensis]|uniref:LysR family transcriptional regulator n=1 Tax=Sphingomonas qilianensis TaxID=1736690 RepID=A0ABU9XUW6_9SPHN
MRFKGLDLNLVVALDTLLEERSVSRTALRLNLSQPAVSAALARLRDYFADELLVLVGRRMIPTAYAETLWPIARALLDKAELLIDTSSGFDPATSRRRFRVNASDYIQSVLIAPVLRNLHERAPHISMDVGPTGPQSIAQFESGEIDLIVSPEEYVSPSHPSYPLLDERHVVVGWSGNPAMNMPIDLDAFLSLGHIAVSIGAGRAIAFAERHLLPFRDRRRIEVTSSTFSGVPMMLQHTNRIAVLQERLAVAYSAPFELKLQPLPFDMPVLHEMVQYHAARANDAGIAWLVGEFRSVAAVPTGTA